MLRNPLRDTLKAGGFMHPIARRLCLTACILVSGTLAVSSAKAQMCVLYARSLTDFTIHGDAWTWWSQAAARYGRGHQPEIGSVLVFERTRSIPQGHVSVVSGVVNSREIRVDHSWLSGQGLYRGMLVEDTSPRNDWTSVRVWDPATHSMGTHVYPTYGFIYAHGGGHVVEAELASRDGRAIRPRMIASAGRYGRFAIPEPERKPVFGEATKSAKTVLASLGPLPGHKPDLAPQAHLVTVAMLPLHKPGADWVMPERKPAAARPRQVATRPGAADAANLGD